MRIVCLYYTWYIKLFQFSNHYCLLFVYSLNCLFTFDKAYLTTYENELIKNTSKPWFTGAISRPFYALFKGQMQYISLSLSDIYAKAPKIRQVSKFLRGINFRGQ